MSRKLSLALTVACLACGCASSGMEPEPDYAVRAQMSVKAALLEADEVAAAPIRVEYIGGSVHLTGFVETEAEKERAAEAARRAVPDLRVVDKLEVWRPGD